MTLSKTLNPSFIWKTVSTARKSRTLNLLFQVALVLVLWVEMVSFPLPPQTSLDPSWNETLIRGAAQHWQFGKDLVFTYGPLGYLTSPYHLGVAGAGARLSWETWGKLAVASGLIFSIRRRAPIHQLLFAAGCGWCGWIMGISFYLIVIAVVVIEVLMNRQESLRAQLVCVVLLGFLAQLKFTNLVLGAYGVGLAIAYYFWIRRWRTGLYLGSAFAVSLLAWWAAAGQDFENLIPYLRTSLEISRGYAHSMGLEESGGVFTVGLAIAAGWLAFVLQLAFRRGDRAHAVTAAAFLAVNAFMWWKYGFIRADAHTNGLYLATFLFAVLLPTALFPERRWQWFWAFGLLGFLGFRSHEPALFPVSFPFSVARMINNARELSRCGSLREKWRQELNPPARACYLPVTNRIVRSDSIDLVSYEQGFLILNGLNYTPRPVFQGYSTYLPSLSQLNLDFYRSAPAPTFILWRQETIDSRFPTLDDALLLPEIARAYRPEANEGGFILLHKFREIPARPLTRNFAGEHDSHFGESIAVPKDSRHPIWMRTAFKLSAWGHLRSYLYKPPQLYMKATDSSGNASDWRILPDIAASGFLLSPLLKDTPDFEAFLKGQAGNDVLSVVFFALPAQKYLWEKQFQITFYTLKEPDSTRSE